MWQDARGGDRFAVVKSYDVSQNGMRLQLPEPVEPRSCLRLQCLELKIHGTASVRSCQRNGMGYMVGLEFLGGLKWNLKPEAAPQAPSEP